MSCSPSGSVRSSPRSRPRPGRPFAATARTTFCRSSSRPAVDRELGRRLQPHALAARHATHRGQGALGAPKLSGLGGATERDRRSPRRSKPAQTFNRDRLRRRETGQSARGAHRASKPRRSLTFYQNGHPELATPSRRFSPSSGIRAFASERCGGSRCRSTTSAETTRSRSRKTSTSRATPALFL